MQILKKAANWAAVILAIYFTLQYARGVGIRESLQDIPGIKHFFDFAKDQITLATGTFLIVISGFMFMFRQIKTAAAVLFLAIIMIVGVGAGGHQQCGAARAPNYSYYPCDDELRTYSKPSDPISAGNIIKFLLSRL